MNNQSNNEYQEGQTFTDPNSANTKGYNDAYYDNNYNTNQGYGNTTDEQSEKRSLPWKLILIVLLALIAIALLIYFLFAGGNKNGDKEYTQVVLQLCEAAKEYEIKNPGLIDREIQGSTAYIKLQKLSDAYLIGSEIKDPRYKSGLFGKSNGKKYIPFTAYVRLAVSSNGEVYCDGLVDTGEDKTGPLVTLIGTDEILIAKGTNFEDPGAKAQDDVDGDITDKIVRSGTVDVTKVGEYTITYRATDASGNSTTKTRKIIVKEYKDLEPTAAGNLDSTAPQLQLKGANPFCLELGKKYIEPGVTAIDNVDGSITDRIIVDNKATGERTGIFRVTYSVEDNAGNKDMAYRSVEVKTSCSAVIPPTTTVPVNTRPTISLIGGSSVIWNKDEVYIDRGSTAWDKEDGDLTNKIRVDASSVNVSLPGIYIVNYEVTDNGGLKSLVKRTITIKDPNASSDVAHFLEMPTNLRFEVGDARDISVPQAKDNAGNLLAVSQVIKGSSGNIVTTVDFYTVEVYTIIYTAKPTNGVAQSVSRTVTIFDSTAPLIVSGLGVNLPKRSTNCDITPADLENAGVKVTDGLNSKKAILRIKKSDGKLCTVSQTAFNVVIDAIDASGNVSSERTLNVRVTDTTPSVIGVTSVELSNCGANGEAIVQIGGTLQLTSVVYPNNATNKSVTWGSSDVANATVSNGLVTGKKIGQSIITVKTVDGGKTQTCLIKVQAASAPIPVTGVNIQGCETGAISLYNGRSTTLVAQTLPNNATNKTITWVSEKTGIATIDNQGVVITKAVGTTTLTATSQDGSKVKTCALTVSTASTIVDATAPTKAVALLNNANATDPYNKNGVWYGGTGKKEIRIEIEAKDPESQICKFQVVDSNDKVLSEISPLASNTNKAIITWTTDINQKVFVKAVNCALMVGEKSNEIQLKLDNTGPTTNFTNWIQDPNSWKSVPKYTVEYSATDTGAGVLRFEYTHDDVKSKADPEIAGTTVTGEKEFLETLNKQYVYVRAVDVMGNAGAWTTNPSYLNMDTVAPNAPVINVKNNNTGKATVGFAFTDGVSTKPSKFGKYTYKLNDTAEQTILLENGTFDILEPNTHKVEAWAFDKAGNKSAASTIKSGIVVIPTLKVNCPETSIKAGRKITCGLDSSTSISGVKLECYNNDVFVRTFTTTSGDKTIYCVPSKSGTMTIKASKEGYATGEKTVNVTSGDSSSTPDDDDDDNRDDDEKEEPGVTFKLECKPITLKVGSTTIIGSNKTVKTGSWTVSNSSLYSVIFPSEKTALIQKKTMAISSFRVSATSIDGESASCTVDVVCPDGYTKNTNIGVCYTFSGKVNLCPSGYTFHTKGYVNPMMSPDLPGNTLAEDGCTSNVGAPTLLADIDVKCPASYIRLGGVCHPTLK